MSYNKPSIYISHAWGGESEKLVQKIMHKFSKEGIDITLDKKDLGYRQSINAFMEKLGQADAIIIVVSNKYLHSEYCMFELLQIYENKNLLERIFPVVLDEVNIAKSTNRLDLVKYWETQTKELENKIRDLDSISNIEGITDDLNLYQNIRTKIAKLTSILKDINTLNIQLHTENDFNILFQAVKKRIHENHAAQSVASNVAPITPITASVATAAAQSEPITSMTYPPAGGKKKKYWLWALVPVLAVAGWLTWSGIASNTKVKGDEIVNNQIDSIGDGAALVGADPGNPPKEKVTTPSSKTPSSSEESTKEPVQSNSKESGTETRDQALINARPPAGTTFQQMKLILDRSVRNAQVLIDDKSLNAWGGTKALNIIQVELPTGTHSFRLIQGKDTCQYQQVIVPNEFEVTLKCQ